MLSSAVAATPRPRPPAKARRASANQAHQASPPPPYAPAFVFPTRATRADPRTRAGTSLEGHTSSHVSSLSTDSATEDWMNDFSREELAEILHKADGLIKERANELGLTSAVAKTLHRNSASLKGRHEALLARIPPSPLSTGFSSPAGCISPAAGFTSPEPAASTPLSNTPHYYSASLRGSTPAGIDSLLLSSTPTPHAHSLHPSRRTRKISVSPTDIALLSDQNAELMQKLERLEAESVQADHAGRRKLNRLEKDIQVLREELERTRERSDALEEKAKNGFGLAAAAAAQEKREREDRMRMLRGSGPTLGEHPEEQEPEIRDFAPGSALRSSPSLSGLKRRGVDADQPLSPSSSSNSVPVLNLPNHEYDVIAQLLAKIQELEETNIQITQQQEETTHRLAAVQRDAENIGKLYDLLGGQAGLDLELVVDNEEGGADTNQKPEELDTIRFKSLRRSLEGQLAKHVLGGGTVRSHNPKARKSVVGYFDFEPHQNHEAETLEADESSSTITGLHPPPSQGVTFPCTPEGDTSRDWTHSRANSGSLLSPALSSLGLQTPHSHTLHQLAQIVSEGEQGGQTLQSELGGAGGVWGADGRPSHHFRTTSLYDLSAIGNDSSSVSGSARSSAAMHRESTPTPDPIGQARVGYGALQLVVDGEDDVEGGGREGQGKPSSRYKRMSQTIRMRTGRWADGRFKGTMLGSDGECEDGRDGQYGNEPASQGQEQPEKTPSGQGRLGDTIDAVIEKLNGSTPSVHAPSPVSSQQHAGASDHSSGTRKERQQKGVGRFIFEAWLWLQFVIIIMVFLWAMARQGPRTVLDAADRKRALKGKH